MVESASSFGRFLKFWRGVHRLSQEQLAFELGSSPRHISRLENGSSRPSETMVLEIAKALKLGRRDQSHLLVAAGFAPRDERVDFNSAELKWLRSAMTMTLQALDPYPACLVDNSTNILMVNRSWLGFYSRLMPADELHNISNFYDFMFSSQSAENAVSNWEDTLSAILMSIQQSALFSNDPTVKATLDRLRSYPSVPSDWQQRAASVEPMASFRVQLAIDGVMQRFFSVSTTVGALGPTAFVSEPQLTVTALYPEDRQLNVDAFADTDLSHPLLFY